jgi:predicted  nucleic acid-binding Zn-ribbon protein
MVRFDDAGQAIAALAEKISGIESEKAALDAVASVKLAEIKNELTKLQSDRKDLSSTIDGELIKLYEKIRSDQGGMGAAEIIRRRCTGCQLDLTAADAARFAATAADEVIRCEECRRILVRSADSGL